MADKTRYPQIPSTVWWGVRTLLHNNPRALIDEKYIKAELGVQETAARQYISELKIIGVLNEDNRATETASRWRNDETYNGAVKEFISRIYDESLLQVAPPDGGDRTKAVNWFLGEGLGRGAAGNKAATYFLIGSPTPNEAPVRAATTSKTEAPKKKSPAKNVRNSPPQDQPTNNNNSNGEKNDYRGQIPLNINVQIHISADAGQEQIEAIFSAMRRYLNDK